MSIAMPPLQFGTTATPPSSRIISLVGIALLHLGFFYAVEHGLISTSIPLLPKEVFLTLAQPEKVQPQEIKQQTTPTKKSVPDTSASIAPSPVKETVPPVITTETGMLAASATPALASSHTEPTSPTSAITTAAAPAQPKLVSAVEYLQAPQTNYPPLSRRMGEEGKVVLRVLVNEKGHAEKVDIHRSSGFQRLDEAARFAIQKAIFKPYLEDGKALSIIATATISFSLDS